jgi:hypothetical protein
MFAISAGRDADNQEIAFQSGFLHLWYVCNKKNLIYLGAALFHT